MLSLYLCAGRQKAKVKSKTKVKSGGRQSKSATSSGSLQPAHTPVDYSRFDTIEVGDEEEHLHKLGSFCKDCGKIHTVRSSAPCLVLSGIDVCTPMRSKASFAATGLTEACQLT